MTQAWSRTELGSSWAHGSCFRFLNSVACSFQRFSESMAVPFGSTLVDIVGPKATVFPGRRSMAVTAPQDDLWSLP